MNNQQASGPDPARSRLRATVSAIDREISRLASQNTGGDSSVPLNSLIESFADLVEQLELGPEPEVRECPVCKKIGMRAATRCGYCWASLIPPREGEP